jgi:hypothetical protein
MPNPADFPRMTAEQIQEIEGLLTKIDSLELKLTVPDTDRQSIVAQLGMDVLDAQIRQVVFFDTPDLQLEAAGLVVRARRSQRRADDTVVKLRPVDPDEVSKKLRKSPSFGIELDALPGGFVVSASMKGEQATNNVRAVAEGRERVSKLFNKEQRKFFEAHRPDGLSLDDLRVLGPINVFKLKFPLEGFPARMVAELWNYPDNTRVLELSSKVPPAKAFELGLQARQLLMARGVDVDAEQTTKTKTALRFFASHLP